MPFFFLLERIVKLRIKTSQDGHFEFRRWVIPTLKPIVVLLTKYNVSKDIIVRFFLKKNKKKQANKQGNERTKKKTKNKKWLKIDNVPTCLLALKSNSKMSNPKSILSCVKRETRQIKTQARYIRIISIFCLLALSISLDCRHCQVQAGCRISFSFCHPTWLAK